MRRPLNSGPTSPTTGCSRRARPTAVSVPDDVFEKAERLARREGRSRSEAVAERLGRLNVPDQLPTVDGLLAATALEHDLILVTRNTRDVRRTGARVLDPTGA